jgi:glycosyltransferase involved in cell wall biosynthesis
MIHAMPEVKSIDEYNINEDNKPVASVVIVTFGPRKEALKRCMDGLRNQTVKEFEIVLVENGSNVFSDEIAKDLSVKKIRLDSNYGPGIARNIGALFADAELLIFLDDDGVPADDFVEEHVGSYEEFPSIIGVRGIVLPLSDKHNPFFSGSYELGGKVVPAMLNVEGNCSVKKQNFMNSGGWSVTGKYAHQGIPLTYELTEGGRYFKSIIYNPKVTIYHDNDKPFLGSYRLEFLSGKNYTNLKLTYQDLDDFLKRYNSVFIEEDDKSQQRKRPFVKRVIDTLFYRLHDLCGVAGRKWQKMLIAINKDYGTQIVDLDFFKNWLSIEKNSVLLK